MLREFAAFLPCPVQSPASLRRLNPVDAMGNSAVLSSSHVLG